MILDIYKLLDRGRVKVTTINVDESQSSIIERLGETDRLSLTITSDRPLTLQIGYCTAYEGKSYYIVKEPTVRMIHATLYHTELEMEAPAGLTKTVIFANPHDKRTTFDYTATPREHLQLIIDSLNAKFFTNDLRWSLGGVHCESKTKHIKYDHETVWEALQTLRETYQTDLYCDGTAISLGKPTSTAQPLHLKYGRDGGVLSGAERLQHYDKPTPRCLYVTGGKRNLAKGTLTLQRSQFLQVLDNGAITRSVRDITAPNVYVTDPEGRYLYDYAAIGDGIVAETTYTNEEIYPSRVSTATSVVKVRDHYEVANDSSINYRDYLIAGETMQIVFQTGELAGRTFDAKYNHDTKRFAIVPTEEDDTTLPNDTLKPKQGDKYIVTGIALPVRYIEEAQKALTDEAVKHLHKLKVTQYSYKIEIDPVYLTNAHDSIAPLLTVGSYVNISELHIAVGDPEVRIIGKRTYLDRPLQPEIELSNEVAPLREPTTQDLISSILGDNIVSLTDKLRGEAEESQKALSVLSKDLANKVDNGELSTAIKQELQDPAIIARYKGRDGADGKDGHTPELSLNEHYQLLADGKLVSSVSLRGGQGDKPTPEEILGTPQFDQLLEQGITTSQKWNDTLTVANTALIKAQGAAERAEWVKGNMDSQVTELYKRVNTKADYSSLNAYTTLETYREGLSSKADTSTVVAYSDYAVELAQNTQAQLCDLKVTNMSDGGVVEVLRKTYCPVIPHYEPGSVSTRPIIQKPVYTKEQIPLTLLSTHNALKAEVATLQREIATLRTQLNAIKSDYVKQADRNKVNTDFSQGGRTTLYPQYDDWLLISDTKEQYISFSGLRAEIGRSIYIQTRNKRAYLYANGHSFYGLPGAPRRGTAVNQWLDTYSTYRFVRSSSDSWAVYRADSKYPW